MNSISLSKSVRTRLARREVLTFPEPFYWTTSGIEELKQSVPDFRKHVCARALDTLNAPLAKTRLACDGDSWFDHPCVRDAMDWIEAGDFAVYRADAPGRLLSTMLKEKCYLRFLDDTTVRAMLLSGGGNDLINWRRPSKDKPSPIFSKGGGSSKPEDFLNPSELDTALSSITTLLREFARDVWGKRPRLPIITHCYDWFVPRTSGPFGAWIGPQLDMVGAPRSSQLRGQIAKLLIDRANEAYARTCSDVGMIFVDLRGTTRERWYDEIHPSSEAFGDIVAKLIASIPKAGVQAKSRGPVKKKTGEKKTGTVRIR